MKDRVPEGVEDDTPYDEWFTEEDRKNWEVYAEVSPTLD